MECLACRQANPPEADYCQSCELPLGLLCPNCGARSPHGAHACIACGTPLEETSPPSGTLRDDSPPSQVPETPTDFSNGRYQVKTLLGQGSKKTVYLAYDTLLDRDVAFALIKTEGDEVSGGRIVREAQAMGRLSAHTNIVTVFDLGEHDGQPFMVTELMAGGDLGTLIDKAPDHRIPLKQALDIARSVCLGLEFAHSHGIVHRDLKPGNVWLSEDGTAKIGDFGLAFSVDSPRLTREGMMVGTLYYMPPEQATGRGVTTKSDLYSLGAMLYEMVTGTPPFLGGDAVSIIGQHVNNVPVPPTWHCPSCPQPLEDLIVGLLEKTPAARPESTTEVLVALDGIRNSMTLEEAAPFDPRNSIEQVALTVAVERPDLSGRAAPDGTVTVLFSDIESSTSMTERLGDQRAQEVLRAHNAIIRSQVATHEGFEVKSLGDGFMLAFSSARRAVQCAIAIQQSLMSYNEGHHEDPIRVRIGLHAGEVVREVDDFYGKNVILASRIAGQATGGQILVSALLKELTESAGDLRFGDGHDVKLKGLTGTTRVFPIIWDPAGPSDGGAGPAERRRALIRLVSRPWRSPYGKAVIALALGTGVVVAGLLTFGIIPGSSAGPGSEPPPAVGTLPSSSVTLWPRSLTRLVSPRGDVTVAVPAGSVESPVELIYQEVSPEGIPLLPEGYSVSNTAFDLSVGGPQADAGGTFSFLGPITISVVISAEDAALAAGVQSNVVIQHFKSGGGWSPLPTQVDFQASTAQTETASLSVFALTIRKPPQTPDLAPVPAATAVPTPTPTPTPALTPVPTPKPTPVPEYLLETGILPEGQGTVEVLPNVQDRRYLDGTVVLVFARCSTGFVSWAGDVPGVVSQFSNPIAVAMDRPRSLVARCAGPAPTVTPAAVQAPTATPKPTPTPAPTRTPTPTPLPAPTLAPTLGGLASGNVITVQYSYFLFPQDSPSGNSWEPGETLYQPSWSFGSSSPVRYLITTAEPLNTHRGSPPSASAIGPSGSYTYEWLPDEFFNLSPEEALVVDSGLRLQRDATPSMLQPGVNQVSIRVVAELLRQPTVAGMLAQPSDGNLRAKIGDKGSGFELGAETPITGGGSPIKVVSVRGTTEIDFDSPVEVGRVYTLEFEVGLLNPNSFPVIFSPTVDANIDLEALPLGLEAPVGSASNTAAVSLDLRGAAGETLHVTLENPSGEDVDWQVKSQYGPIFEGLGQYWNGVLARGN